MGVRSSESGKSQDFPNFFKFKVYFLFFFLSFIEVFLFKRYRAVIFGYIIFIKYSFIDQLSMKRTHFNVAWKIDTMFQSWLLEDPASKHNFKFKVCQSTLDLGNIGKAVLSKHIKSVEHVRNSEGRKSSSAA